MNFIYLSSIAGTSICQITISYDIACQWSQNLIARMGEMPQWLWLPESLQLRYGIPKFHLPAHVQKCWAHFSFNFMQWVGRTDGKGVERNWSWLNSIAHCVSMMGPGGRWDTLNDFCNYHNWRKSINLGESFFVPCDSLSHSDMPGDQLL
jgi:Kyakuja-Dileera-Zisupton transposase